MRISRPDREVVYCRVTSEQDKDEIGKLESSYARAARGAYYVIIVLVAAERENRVSRVRALGLLLRS